MSEKQYVGFTTKTSVFVTRSHVSDAAVYTTVIFFSEYELDFLACFFSDFKKQVTIYSCHYNKTFFELFNLVSGYEQYF